MPEDNQPLQPIAPNPPLQPSKPTEDVSGLKNKNAELLTELKTFKEKYVDLEQQFQGVIGVLGTTNPDALKQLKEAEETARSAKIEYEKQISQVRSEVSSQYESQLRETNEKLSQQQKLITQKLQLEALRELHQSNDGQDFEGFTALMATKFQFEYEEIGKDHSGFPKYKVKNILQKDGSPLFLEGKEAKPADVLARVRQGEYGQTISSTFKPWNQTGGGTLPRGISGSNGVIRYPRSQRPALLAADRTGEFKQKMANGEVQFYDG